VNARQQVFVVAAVVLITAITYRTSPSFGHVGDSVFLIEQNPWMRDPGRWWTMISTDYFSAASGETIGYWRPLTKLSWLYETLLAEGWPGIHHMVSVFWLAVGAAGVSALAIALRLPAWAAALAGTLVAVHPVAIEPTALIMARSDVVCFAGVAWAQVGFVRWLRLGSWMALAAAVLTTLLAWSSKEAAVVLVPLAGLYAAAHALGFGELSLTVEKAPSRPAEGATDNLSVAIPSQLNLTRSVLLLTSVGVVSAVWMFLRSQIVVGEGSSVTFDPLRIVTGIGTYLSGSLPLVWAPEIRNVSIAEALDTSRLLTASAATLSLLVLAAVFARTRATAALLMLAWWGGSLAPVLLQSDMSVPGAEGHLVYSDRWALQAVAATALLVAAGVANLKHVLFQRVAVAVLGVWAMAMVIVAPLQRAPYQDGFTMLAIEDVDYEATPEQYRTLTDTCRYVERAILRAHHLGDIDEVLAGWDFYRGTLQCGQGGDVLITVLGTLVAANRFDAALPVAEEIVRGEVFGRNAAWLHQMVARVFCANGQWQRCLSHINSASALGVEPCSLAPPATLALLHTDQIPAAVSTSTMAAQCIRDGGQDDTPFWMSILQASHAWASTTPAASNLTQHCLQALANRTLSPTDAALRDSIARNQQAAP